MERQTVNGVDAYRPDRADIEGLQVGDIVSYDVPSLWFANRGVIVAIAPAYGPKFKSGADCLVTWKKWTPEMANCPDLLSNLKKWKTLYSTD